MATQIAVGLIVEILQVVARVATGRRRLQHLLMRFRAAPLVDARQIGEEEAGLAQGIERAQRHRVLGQPIMSFLDVAPILLEERAQIGEDARAIGHALFELGGRRHLAGETRAQPFLPEIPGYAQPLRSAISEPFERVGHGL